MKIVILYSSIGYGHISAARAIEKEILQADSSATVVLKDIREFMSPLWRRIDERLYWFIVNNLPESFDALFWSLQEAGSNAYSIAAIPADYPDNDILEYIRQEDPQVVLATHYGSAQVLARLRECEQLTGVKLGWLHTDFFEGYFPRISMWLDCTFLGHSELSANWLQAGVPQDKILVSGMPVDTLISSYSEKEILARYNLVETLPIVLIAGGKEGVCDYQGVIAALADKYEGQLQVVALCGANTRKKEAIERQTKSFQSRVSTLSLGLVPHSDIVSLMYAADLLVTKAGGLTPSEAFTIGLPTVLLDVVRGHERENAILFTKLGVAYLATNGQEAGLMAVRLLHDEAARQQMIEKQKLFCESSNISAIAHFALNSVALPRQLPSNFGSEHGQAPSGTQDVLTRLDSDVPNDFELLLSYATSQKPERIALENPFGHIAIRVGETVYSANHLAKQITGAPLLQKISLEEYLFGITPPPGNQEHTNTYGMAYGRDTLGLRVKGVNERLLISMLSEAERIEEEYKAGIAMWNLRDFNCAHMVTRILEAGGLRLNRRLGVRGPYAMPLDVFESALSLFQSTEDLLVNLVSYRRLIGSQAAYRYTHFPLAVNNPIRALSRILKETSIDKLEEAVIMQVANFGDDRLFVEKHAWGRSNQEMESRKKKRLLQALHVDAIQLFDIRAKLNKQRLLDVISDVEIFKETKGLIHRANHFARQATEHAEEIMPKRASKQIRERFSRLAKEYGSQNEIVPVVGQIKGYLMHLDEFHHRLISEIQAKSNVMRSRKKGSSVDSNWSEDTK